MCAELNNFEEYPENTIRIKKQFTGFEYWNLSENFSNRFHSRFSLTLKLRKIHGNALYFMYVECGIC